MTTAFTHSGRRSGLLTSGRSTATSESARTIGKLREDIRRHLLASYSVSSSAERALEELAEVQNEAGEQGWNGYDSKPIDLDACAHAKHFLEALPTTAPAPEIGADPDGDVALDWIFGQRKALSISIGPTGRCTYAWIRGQRTCRGTDWLDDGIPEAIVNALYELARDVAPSQRSR